MGLGQMEGSGAGRGSPDLSQGLRVWAFGPRLYSLGASRQPMEPRGWPRPPARPRPWPLARGLPGGEGEAGRAGPACGSLGALSSVATSLPHPHPPPGPAGGWRETVHLVTSRCLAPSGPPGESGYCHYPHLTTREAETHVVTEMSRPRTPVGCSVSTGLRCLPLALSVTLSSRRGRWPSGDHPGGSGFKSWLCRLLAVLPRAGPFASWSLPLLIRKMGGGGVKMEPPSAD